MSSKFIMLAKTDESYKILKVTITLLDAYCIVIYYFCPLFFYTLIVLQMTAALQATKHARGHLLHRNFVIYTSMDTQVIPHGTVATSATSYNFNPK